MMSSYTIISLLLAAFAAVSSTTTHPYEITECQDEADADGKTLLRYAAALTLLYMPFFCYAPCHDIIFRAYACLLYRCFFATPPAPHFHTAALLSVSRSAVAAMRLSPYDTPLRVRDI